MTKYYTSECYRIFFQELFLLEELNRDSVENALKKAGKSEFFDKIMALDPTKDSNKVYSVKLTKFFLEQRPQNDEKFFEILKYYFNKFMTFKNKKLLKGTENDLNSYKNFEDFHNTLDKFEAQLKNTKSSDYIEKLNLEPKLSNSTEHEIEVFGKKIDKHDVTYNDDNIIVVRADDPIKSKRYGDGFSDWCTARKFGNLFYNYRFKNNPETMFYVYMLKKQPNDMEQVLHFGVTEDGEISYTDKNNDESRKTLKWLGKKFPEIQPAIEKNAFKFVPISSEERRIQQLPDEIDIPTFRSLSYHQKEMWFMSGDRKISFEIWNELDENFKNIVIRSFEDREDDLDTRIKKVIAGTKYEVLYRKAIKERLIDKVRDRYHAAMTDDEVDVVIIEQMYDVLPHFREGDFYKLVDRGGTKFLRHDIVFKIITKLKFDTDLLIPWAENKEELFKKELRLGYSGIINNYLSVLENPADMVDYIHQHHSNLIRSENIETLFKYSRNKEELFKTALRLGNWYIIQGIPVLENPADIIDKGLPLLENPTDMVDYIVQHYPDFIDSKNIEILLKYSRNKEELFKKALEQGISGLINYLPLLENPADMVDYIVQFYPDLINKENTETLLKYSGNKAILFNTMAKRFKKDLKQRKWYIINDDLPLLENPAYWVDYIVQHYPNVISSLNIETLLKYSGNKPELFKTALGLGNWHIIDKGIPMLRNPADMVDYIVRFYPSLINSENIETLLKYSRNKEELLNKYNSKSHYNEGIYNEGITYRDFFK